MPDLLGPANPVPGYNSSNVKIAPPMPGDANIQNVTDPDRVVRPDGKTEQQDTGDATASHAMRYESNFMTFLQRLKNTPTLTQAFVRLLQGQGLQVTSGIREGLAGELSQFLEMVRMDEGQLLDFLQGQMKSGARFGGALFQALRAAYSNAQSDLLRTDILQFLRQYSDFSSTAHLEGKLLRTLQSMAESLPGKWAEQVFLLSAKLENGVAAGDRAGNAALLREELFPLMARYVSMTHDHGRARSLLSMMTLDLVRYENGAEGNLLQGFRQLCANGVLQEDFDRLTDDEILRLLKSTDFYKAAKNDAFADRLASLTNRALKGEGGVNAQEAFRNLMSSILLNESVYMPLRHILIPMEWNGRPAFSEMWVDPDAEPERRQQAARTMRFLIKMDIQGLGAFDVLLNASADKVALQIACPEAVAPFSDEVARGMDTILKRNGFQPDGIQVARMKRPITLSEAYPKIFERMSGVNVKI